jgi:DNA-binding NtrC family response regulator
MRSRILFLSGHPSDARRLNRMLRSLPLVVDHAENLRQAREQLQAEEYDVVLTEAALPDGNWLDAMTLTHEGRCAPLLIVTAPHADARLWSEALNLGAYDLLAQPFEEPEVRRILSNACSRPVSQPSYQTA